jgi:hypothetical protein
MELKTASFNEHVLIGAEMGRPTKPAHLKRQLLSVRFDPEVRTAFENAAEKTGKSLSSEIERRATILANADEDTLDLIEQIVSEIDALETRNRGKRWHVDLRTWSGVAEMLANGPIREMKPTNDVDQEAQDEARGPVHDISEKQRDAVAALKNLGVAVQTERNLTMGLGGSYNNRDLERAAIEAIPDINVRAEALELFAGLEQLDAEYEAATARWQELMQPYWDAENQGRQDYRDHLHELAVQRRDRGEPFNLAHLVKWFEPWR